MITVRGLVKRIVHYFHLNFCGGFVLYCAGHDLILGANNDLAAARLLDC